MFLEFLHLVLVEGFHDHGLARDDVVEGVAEVFEAVVHALDFGGEQVAGSEDDEAVEVQVALLVEEQGRDVQRKRWDRVARLEVTRQLDYELRILGRQVLLQRQRQPELAVGVGRQLGLLDVAVHCTRLRLFIRE